MDGDKKEEEQKPRQKLMKKYERLYSLWKFEKDNVVNSTGDVANFLFEMQFKHCKIDLLTEREEREHIRWLCSWLNTKQISIEDDIKVNTEDNEVDDDDSNDIPYFN